MQRYSTTQAVREVMQEMSTGDKLIGYELYNKVLSKLRINGNRKRPLDSTVLRIVRDVGSFYGVKAQAQGISVYVKDTKSEDVKSSACC